VIPNDLKNDNKMGLFDKLFGKKEKIKIEESTKTSEIFDESVPNQSLILEDENEHHEPIEDNSIIEQSEEVEIRPRFLIRQTLWSHVGGGDIVYGGYGNIHSHQYDIDSANKLVAELTYKSSFNEWLNQFESFNFTEEGLKERLKTKFDAVFNLSNEESNSDLYLWRYNSTIEQANEVIKVLEYPLVSIIEKDDDIFYLNMLNKDFWGDTLFYEMLDSMWDFTCHEYFKKHIYNDEITAIKDGVKKILCRLIKYPNNAYFEYLQNKIDGIVDKVIFEDAIKGFKDYISNEQNYWKMIYTNNIFSTEFEECFSKIGHIFWELKPYTTHPINYHEATFYNFSGFIGGTSPEYGDYVPEFSGIIHKDRLWDMYKDNRFFENNISLRERKEFWSDRHLLKCVFNKPIPPHQ
jgi:hypothetical protein